MHGLEWREGQGLYAVDVKWTEAARASIQADEYRYISPVFSYSPTTGEVLHLVNAALTNSPALDGMDSAVALRLQHEAQGAELATLRHEVAQREINDLVEKAAEAGCLLPYQMDAARELAVSNLVALKILLDRPPLIHFGEIATLKRRFGAEAAHGLNWADLRMCELSGRSPEEFAALKTRFTPNE